MILLAERKSWKDLFSYREAVGFCWERERLWRFVRHTDGEKCRV